MRLKNEDIMEDAATATADNESAAAAATRNDQGIPINLCRLYRLKLERYRKPEAIGLPSRTIELTDFVEEIPPNTIEPLTKLHVEQVVLSRNKREIPLGMIAPVNSNSILYHDSPKDAIKVVELCERHNSAKALVLRARPNVKTTSKFPIVVISNRQLCGTLAPTSTTDPSLPLAPQQPWVLDHQRRGLFNENEGTDGKRDPIWPF